MMAHFLSRTESTQQTSRRDRFMHFEYWEKGSMSERLWVLIPARKEGPTQEKVEELVWSEVMYVEGIARPNPFRRD
jgi:hypothetical protein